MDDSIIKQACALLKGDKALGLKDEDINLIRTHIKNVIARRKKARAESVREAQASGYWAGIRSGDKNDG